MTDPKPAGRGRGFASMTPEQRRVIASQGGKAAHAGGHAHQFTTEEARAAGLKSHGRARQAARERGERVPQDDEAHEALDQD